MTRGIDNNDPFNIRKSAIRWQGEVDGKDTSFETFDTAQDGIRAGCKILLTYYRKYGLETVADIITRFAPPAENNTDAYIRSVAADLRVREDQPLEVDHSEILGAFAAAIIKHENGQQPYSAETIDAAVKSALEA